MNIRAHKKQTQPPVAKTNVLLFAIQVFVRLANVLQILHRPVTVFRVFSLLSR